MTPAPGHLSVEVESCTRDRDKRPFVSFRLGNEGILLEPNEARQLALVMIDMASRAEYESAVVRVELAEPDGTDVSATRKIIGILEAVKRIQREGVN